MQDAFAWKLRNSEGKKTPLLSSCIVGVLDLYAEKWMNQHLVISIGPVTFKQIIFFLAVIVL